MMKQWESGAKVQDEKSPESVESFYAFLSKYLSVRTWNALRRSKRVYDIESFLQLSEEEIATFRNIGKTSIKDFLRAKARIRNEFPNLQDAAEGTGNVHLPLMKALASTLRRNIPQQYGNRWKRQGQELLRLLLSQLPDCMDEIEKFGKDADVIAVSEEFWGTMFCRAPLEEFLAKKIEQAADAFFPVSLEDIQTSVYRKFPIRWTQQLPFRDVLERLVEAGHVLQDADGFRTCRKSAHEVLEGNERISPTVRSILYARADGRSLREIGEASGLSGTCVQQLEKKTILFGLHDTREDSFAVFFKEYSFPKAVLGEVFGIDDFGIYYLEKKYAKGTRDSLDAWKDERFPLSVRKTLRRRSYLVVDGEYLLPRQPDVIRYFLSHFCQDEISLEAFFQKYEFFLDLLGHADDPRLALDVRASNHRIASSHLVLWKRGKILRYYDADAVDMESFLQDFHFDDFHDVIISAQLFLDRYPEEARKYDFRDAYEFHNFLKKRMSPELLERYNLSVQRMPTLAFGTASDVEQAIELVRQEGFIEKDEMAELYRREYGVLPETFRAKTEPHLRPYLHDGRYTLDIVKMPEEDIGKLKAALPRNLYFSDQVRELMRQLFPGRKGIFNQYNLWQAGFEIHSHTVSRNGFPTLLAALKSQMGDMEVLQVADHISDYRMILYPEILTLDIIEFAEGQFIRIERLQRIGVGKEDLQAVNQEILRIVGDAYFTLQSLRRQDVHLSLDRLGFDDMFIESVLRYSGTFQSVRVGNAYLFHHGETSNLEELLEDILQDEESMDIDELVELLSEIYGIRLQGNYRIQEIARNPSNDLFYQDIMHKIYRDYDAYYQEA